MISQHTVKAFDADLQELTRLANTMSSLAAEQVCDAVDALLRGDMRLAHAAIVKDTAIDAIQREIEDRAVATIAGRPPMAIDLRHVVGFLRIANDLERIGDLAKNIAKRARALNKKPTLARPIGKITRMAALLLDQLKLGMDAFSTRDRVKAVKAWESDAGIDALFKSVVRNLVEYMSEGRSDITVGVHLLFCAKNIEKMGDHVTHIAETAYYVIEGCSLAETRLTPPATTPPNRGAA